MKQLEQLKAKALYSKSLPKHAEDVINDHLVQCFVAVGYRNTGKNSVRWKINGKVIAFAALKVFLEKQA